jgi:hypothetical protein
MSEMLMEE